MLAEGRALDLGFDYHFAVPQNHGDASGIHVRNRDVVGLRSDRSIDAGKSAYGRDFKPARRWAYGKMYLFHASPDVSP